MDDTRKQELFPYFAYLYSQQLNPEKYGKLGSIDEWIKVIQGNEEDVNQITEAAKALTDTDWDDLDTQYTAQTQNEEAQLAAKGAKLQKLKKTPKKCKCGCDMITVKEKGGKISSKCSCNCKGGSIKKASAGIKLSPAHQVAVDIANDYTRSQNHLVNNPSPVTKAPIPALDPVRQPKQLTFDQAFAAARKAGLKIFPWNGKNYTTDLAETKPAAVKPAAPITPTSASKPAGTSKTTAPATNRLPASPNSKVSRPPEPEPVLQGRRPTAATTSYTNPYIQSAAILTDAISPQLRPAVSAIGKGAVSVWNWLRTPSAASPQFSQPREYKKGGPVVKVKAKQSGGDINQPIGTTKQGGTIKKPIDRVGKVKGVIVPAPALKCGGKSKKKITKK